MNDTRAPAVIIGLGNPGAKHAADRHNAGFWLLDRLAAGQRFRDEAKLAGAACQVTVAGRSLRLVKPSTFMNASGQCARRVMDYYHIAIGDILVAHDEVDLPPGAARLKTGGGHGGHNGLRDIIAHCGAQFPRLRLGIGHPGHKDAVVAHVLHAPGRDERALIEDAIGESARSIETWITHGLQRATTYLHTATPRDAGLGPAG